MKLTLNNLTDQVLVSFLKSIDIDMRGFLAKDSQAASFAWTKLNSLDRLRLLYVHDRFFKLFYFSHVPYSYFVLRKYKSKIK
jgi:hypothetical protein